MYLFMAGCLSTETLPCIVGVHFATLQLFERLRYIVKTCRNWSYLTVLCVPSAVCAHLVVTCFHYTPPFWSKNIILSYQWQIGEIKPLFVQEQSDYDVQYAIITYPYEFSVGYLWHASMMTAATYSSNCVLKIPVTGERECTAVEFN
jgi:hypothetical protein